MSNPNELPYEEIQRRLLKEFDLSLDELEASGIKGETDVREYYANAVQQAATLDTGVLEDDAAQKTPTDTYELTEAQKQLLVKTSKSKKIWHENQASHHAALFWPIPPRRT